MFYEYEGGIRVTLTGDGLDDPGFEFRQGQDIFFTPKCSDWLCGPRSSVLNGYQGYFSGQGGQSVMLAS
jgi:hypothetical protein